MQTKDITEIQYVNANGKIVRDTIHGSFVLISRTTPGTLSVVECYNCGDGQGAICNTLDEALQFIREELPDE